jgi:hypothetical protein
MISLNKNIFIGLTCAAFLMAAVVTQAADAPNLPPAVLAPPPQPTKMPEFEFANLQGGTLKSSEMKGKVIVVRFWATW